jgi:RecA/RadA recombinase
MSFAKNLIDEMNDEFTTIADDEKGSAEFTGFIDTGCFMLNALLSGSIYGGAPNNKIMAFAGEEATGKTFFALSIVKNFLNSHPDAVIVYYDTEAAITADMMRKRGIDTKRVIIAEPSSIQEFRHHAIRLLKAYEASKDRPPMMMVLDSLGMLSTTKELEDTSEGKETKDMTRAQVIRSAFRVLTLKLARAKVPMILTNHTYDVVGSYVPQKTMSGGSGLKYAASIIVYLSKKKERDGTDVVGNIIRANLNKGRLSKENKIVELLLKYESGLDKYYGLLPLAEKYEIIKKVGRQYELADGRKVFGKAINDSPEEIFTPEILDRLEQAAQTEYKYGQAPEDLEVDIEEELADET